MSKIDLHNQVAKISAAYANSDGANKALVKRLRDLQIEILQSEDEATPTETGA